MKNDETYTYGSRKRVQSLTESDSYFRPTSVESAPWHNFHDGAKVRNFERDPAWPHNYYVPSFGVDHEILSTQKSIKTSEGKMGKKVKPIYNKSRRSWDVELEPNNKYGYNNRKRVLHLAQSEYRPTSALSAPWHNFNDGAKARNFERDP